MKAEFSSIYWNLSTSAPSGPANFYKLKLVVMFKVMRSHNCYQMVFSSSCTVYGEPSTLPITEKHPTGSITNVYGRTKYFIEEMLKDLSAADEVKS